MTFQVRPPGLHISLGIFYRLFTLLEDECHEQDIQYSVQLQGSTAGSSFTAFVTALQRQSNLRDAIDRVNAQIVNFEQILTLAVLSLPPNTQTSPLIQQVAEEIYLKKTKKDRNDTNITEHLMNLIRPSTRSSLGVKAPL